MKQKLFLFALLVFTPFISEAQTKASTKTGTITFEASVPSFEEVKAAIKKASENELKGVLGYTEEGVVSQDFVSESKTSTFDANASIGLNDNFVKIISWYDNEYGYSTKLVDLAEYINAVK